MKKITVLISDDHTVVRKGLRLLLEAEADIQVVGEAADGQQSVRETKRLKPDVVLLDLAMPVINGLEAARRIAKEAPSVKVLILSAYSDDAYVEHAMQAGAAGYLMKETAGAELLRGIRKTAQGSTFFSPQVAQRMLRKWQEKFPNGKPIKTTATRLTSRQKEVLQLIADGHATKQIAGLLQISVKTVEKHRQDLMNTLNIHNVASLTRYAVSSGIVKTNSPPHWSASPATTQPAE